MVPAATLNVDKHPIKLTVFGGPRGDHLRSSFILSIQSRSDSLEQELLQSSNTNQPFKNEGGKAKSTFLGRHVSKVKKN